VHSEEDMDEDEEDEQEEDEQEEDEEQEEQAINTHSIQSDSDDDGGVGYGLIRSRSNSYGQQPEEKLKGGAGRAWGGVSGPPEEEEEEEEEESPEDAEIRYLEQKLFSGKYKGDKGKKKLAKEWEEKDGFDPEFASFIMGLGSGGSYSSSSSSNRNNNRNNNNNNNNNNNRSASTSHTTVASRYQEDSSGDSNTVSSSEEEEEEEDNNLRPGTDRSNDGNDGNVVNLYGGRGKGQKLTNADIYGQTPSATTDNGAKPQKYVPPHLRHKQSTSSSSSSSSAAASSAGAATEDERRLQRQVNGLFNRCGEDNIESIANAIHALYSTHPNTLVNASFATTVLNACGDLTATRCVNASLLLALLALLYY